jgi:hypothetical protein
MTPAAGSAQCSALMPPYDSRRRCAQARPGRARSGQLANHSSRSAVVGRRGVLNGSIEKGPGDAGAFLVFVPPRQFPPSVLPLRRNS